VSEKIEIDRKSKVLATELSNKRQNETLQGDSRSEVELVNDRITHTRNESLNPH
jgi:hypothetical protein